MKKIAYTMSAIMLAGTLVACGTADNAANDRQNISKPIGFSTDDNDNLRRGFIGQKRPDTGGQLFDGRGRMDDRKQGPLTDMIDGSDQRRFSDNPQNGNRRAGFKTNENLGHYDGTDRKLARQISRRVKDINGIRDARTIVYGDQIVVGVNTTDKSKKNIKKKVRSAVRDMVHEQRVTVVTDNKMFNRIRDVDDNLRNGNGMNEVQADINAILTDLGDAIKRPFQNNVK